MVHLLSPSAATSQHQEVFSEKKKKKLAHRRHENKIVIANSNATVCLGHVFGIRSQERS